MPSKKAVKQFRKNVRGILRTGNMDPWDEVAAKLNRLLVGWSSYFSYGSQAGAGCDVDRYVQGRVRHFLKRRMKLAGRGTAEIPEERVFGELGVLSVRKVPHRRYASAFV
jgi:RNA-directed DNA polymerase